MKEIRALAEELFSLSEDMDWADYEYTRDETVAAIMAELDSLTDNSVLLSCLRTIADLD